MRINKGIVIGALAGGLALSAATAAAAGNVVKVASGAELAAAIISANSDPSIGTIKCLTVGGCDFAGTLPAFTGTQALVINGRLSTIDASGITDTDVFTATGGGNLNLQRLTFIGGMTGVYVELPADRTGGLQVEFHRVKVLNADLHGVHINDANSSAASIRLIITSSSFLDNGFGADDQDGVRVNETGKGMIDARVTGSYFKLNGSDGLSLDETGGGGVSVTIDKSYFLSNGENPANLADPDDGFDIDERGSGDVWLTVTDSRFNKNFDDGLDIDERGAGTIYSNLENVKATKNLDQGIAYDERLAGDIFATISDSTVTGNDADSQKIDLRGEQSDNGNGTLTMENVVIGQSALTGLVLITNP